MGTDEAFFDSDIPSDRDNDSILDFLDIDADNDGIPDVIEGDQDRDGDGVADYRDLDVDNDGIFDLIESRIDINDITELDANVDGIIDPDRYSSGENGLADIVELGNESGAINYQLQDVDGDGIEDYRDHDSDNDGLMDTTESGHPDNDFDGFIDELSLDTALFNDASVNDTGLALAAGNIPPNSDDDILADFRDGDSDNDGLTDAFEAAGFLADTDSDGRLDGFVDSDADGSNDSVRGIAPPDTDNDGIADHLDRDSDQDTLRVASIVTMTALTMPLTATSRQKVIRTVMVSSIQPILTGTAMAALTQWR